MTPRCHALDYSADAGCAKAFVILTPADDAAIGGELDEMIVAPARVGGQQFNALDFHVLLPVTQIRT